MAMLPSSRRWANRCVGLITARLTPQILVVGMYARLPQSEQAKVFAPVAAGATRKIILATNIAETSITIPGVKYVVDTGLMKEKRFYASLSASISAGGTD